MHQGLGLDAFNAMPMRRAVHAIYECCFSVPLAADAARARPYSRHGQLFERADELLYGLSEDSIEVILQAHPDIGRRPGSERSRAEQCAITDQRPAVMDQLDAAAKRYLDHFGFHFVMYVDGCSARDVLATIADRLLNDVTTERKVVRGELSRIHRTRLERMLGPEGGYNNW